jgi:ELWxxDGT repeat protein
MRIVASLIALATSLTAQTAVFDLNPGPDSSAPGGFVDLLGTAVFWANGSGAGDEPWRSDGTATGTYRLADITPGSGGTLRTPFVSTGELAFFTATTSLDGQELWVTDGTVAGTRIVRDMVPGSGSTAPERLTVVGARLLFTGLGSAGRELHVSDGTFAGTGLVKDIRPGAGSSSPYGFAALGDRLYFLADDGVHGTEIWSSDGTAVGTQLFADLIPSGSARQLGPLAVADGRLWFGITNGSANAEVWTSDGIIAGTRMVSHLPDPGTLLFSSPRGVGQGCLITTLASGGIASYIADGTTNTTQRLAVQAGSSSPSIRWRGELFFLAGLPGNAIEFWRTDGTFGGTRRVNLGPGSPSVQSAVALGSRLLVETLRPPGIVELIAIDTANGASVLYSPLNVQPAVADSRHVYFQDSNGTALRRTDGTAAGTISLGPTTRWVSAAGAGGRLFFDGLDAALGRELHVYEVGAAARPIGATCPSGKRTPQLTITDPVLGAGMQVDVADLAPQALFVAMLSAPATPTPLGVCRVYVELNTAIVLGPLASQSGVGQFTLPIPDDPALLGIALVTQAAASGPSGMELTNAYLLRLGR